MKEISYDTDGRLHYVTALEESILSKRIYETSTPLFIAALFYNSQDMEVI